ADIFLSRKALILGRRHATMKIERFSGEESLREQLTSAHPRDRAVLFRADFIHQATSGPATAERAIVSSQREILHAAFHFWRDGRCADDGGVGNVSLLGAG